MIHVVELNSLVRPFENAVFPFAVLIDVPLVLFRFITFFRDAFNLHHVRSPDSKYPYLHIFDCICRCKPSFMHIYSAFKRAFNLSINPATRKTKGYLHICAGAQDVAKRIKILKMHKNAQKPFSKQYCSGAINRTDFL